MAKRLKVGLAAGGGPPPGYRWTVLYLQIGRDEAMGFLSEDEYQHAVMQIRDLAEEQDPTHPTTLSVDAVEDFHELREKGGILGNKNVRVFFFLDKPRNSLVILGAVKKQNDGPTPLGDRRRMARRKRKYLNGDYGSP